MLYYTIQILISTLIIQIIFFKFLQLHKKWFHITIFSYIFCFIIIVIIYKASSLNFFLFNFIIITSYVIFLTAVFNDSPTVKVIELSKNEFLKKKFINNRLNLMLEDNLVDLNYKIKKKGIIIYRSINILSNIFFKED